MNSKLIIATAVLLIAAFAGVSVIGTDSDAEATGYAVAYVVDGKTYTVPQVAGEGVTPGTVTLASLASLGASEPAHKTFVAWNTMADGSGTAYTAGSTYIINNYGGDIAQTATLYATFEWTKYTASFVGADGTPIETFVGTAEDGKVIDLAERAPAAPHVDGKIFAGWYSSVTGKPVQTKDLGKLTETVTYTALYSIDYKITFIDGDKTYISKVSDLTVPDLGQRTGFTFLGWFVGTEQVADPESYDFKADTTFTAKWEPMNVYVTFVAGSFKTVVAVLYGQTVVEPALPDGYVAWDFDFSKAVTEDITVNALAAAPAKPSGMADPIVMTIVIILGVLVLVAIAGVIYLRKTGKIVIGRGPKTKTEEEKKE